MRCGKIEANERKRHEIEMKKTYNTYILPSHSTHAREMPQHTIVIVLLQHTLAHDNHTHCHATNTRNDGNDMCGMNTKEKKYEKRRVEFESIAKLDGNRFARVLSVRWMRSCVCVCMPRQHKCAQWIECDANNTNSFPFSIHTSDRHRRQYCDRNFEMWMRWNPFAIYIRWAQKTRNMDRPWIQFHQHFGMKLSAARRRFSFLMKMRWKAKIFGP